MQTEIIATYLTKSGELAIEITKQTIGSNVSYRYTGKFGAGCSKDYKHVVTSCKLALSRRRDVWFAFGQNVCEV